MQWRLPRARSPLPASIAILFLPILAATQQLSASRADDGTSLPAGGHASASSHPLYHGIDSSYAQHFRDTHAPSQPAALHVSSGDASALATLALAGKSRAVRAPPAQTSSPSGLAPQLHARSLQDWEVEDFVLLATVDGTIHARDRKTGAARWALEVPSSPMVETIYHRQNYSGFNEVQAEDDFIWIVEPSRDGNLFVYNQAPEAGLQKLDLTVKKLVDETPYSGRDPAVTYTARKETTIYTVDARTGSILRVFSSRGPITPEQSCRKVNGLDMTDEEDCESSGTLTIGRVEYTVAVQNTETGHPVCTIKYSEWTPNTRDGDLQSQYFRTMDKRHIYSMHDGVIFGFDHSKADGRRYTQKFSSPVARVFDVVRPANAESPETPLVVLPQPLDPPDPDYSSIGLDDRESRVFINCTETGGWFAMSESTYPLVTGRARQAECYEKDYSREQPLTSLELAQQRAALVGVHSLSEPSFRQTNIPKIAAPPLAELANDTPRDVARYPSEFRPAAMIRKSWDNALDIFVTLIFIFLATFVYFNSHNIQELAKQKLDLKNVINSQGKPLSTPSTPVVGAPPMMDNVEVNPSDPLDVHRQAPSNITVNVPISDTKSGDATPRQRPTVDEETPRVRIREPSAVRGEDGADGPGSNEPERTKRKARRGRRGGQAHKRKQKPTSDDGSKDDSDHTVQNGGNLQPPSTGAEPGLPLARTSSHETVEVDPDGSLRIGQLKVYSDTVLGHGSHGTVVYKGSFDGRNVAVKRMLVEFYDIASHEVGLLQESDDHNNVIRYYCREQAAGFLYIALELCPASLQDVIERPLDFPDLVGGGLDLPDMLLQITAGVRYLHSLKIVHRDLKPQNILAASPRLRTGSPALRLLISDFGLCKKLEDNQSSFRATTAHAAGTSGWRAPELLVDDDQVPPNVGAWDGSLDSSEPAVVDPQTNRRATRAIDIFSLGCVFYYVLTRGGHPFDKDGKFMREANIVKGHHNLDELQRLGDYAFEADDLVRQMLSLDPHRRPDAAAVMLHPFFWAPAERLSFLCDVSDHFEFEPRDPPSEALQCLESVARSVMGPDMDFLRLLPKEFKDSLGKQRKYTGSKMLDLLRALRNKRNHYNDMSEHLKAHIGGLPIGYLQFWAVRFPSLLINCHWVVMELGLEQNDRFKRYFTLRE